MWIGPVVSSPRIRVGPVHIYLQFFGGESVLHLDSSIACSRSLNLILIPQFRGSICVFLEPLASSVNDGRLVLVR